MSNLDDYIHRWLNQMNCSDSSRATYCRALGAFNRWMHINKRYNAMGATVDDLNDYRKYLLKEKSPYTTCSYIVAIRMFYRFLYESGIKEKNPAARLKGVKRNRYYNKLPLSDEQSRALLESVDTTTEKGKRDRVILLLMLHAGLRCCEVARMEAGDIIEVGGTRSVKLQRKGHTAKDEIIPLRRDIVAALEDYAAARKWKPNEPVIISYQSKGRDRNQPPKPLTAHAVERITTKLLIAAGIKDEKITTHSLRHTFACMLVEKGVEMHKIQRLMGHISSQITAIYTKMQDERAIFKENPAELLEDL